MITERIVFSEPVLIVHSEELYRKIYFITDKIRSFVLLNDDSRIYGIDVTMDQGTDLLQIERKINQVIQNEILPQKVVEASIIWSSSNKAQYHDNAYGKLATKGYVFEMGEGMSGFAEPFIKLMDSLDRIIRNIAVCDMKGEEYQYPTMISTKTMEETGYFNSFPHMLMFLTHLHNDIDVYNDFYDYYNKNGQIDPGLLKFCNNTDYCLPPTMCYHTYQHLRGHELGEHENRVITSRGKSFRYEGKYHHHLERLWDFTIREIVFLGTKDFVCKSRERFMRASFKLVEHLGLTGHCEVANDPFFCSPNTAAKVLNQKIMKLKYELRLNIEKDKTIAAASFNYHEQFFGQRFQIEQKESFIYSGCVGFGLERLAYTFVCHYGVNEEDWWRVLDRLEKAVEEDSLL